MRRRETTIRLTPRLPSVLGMAILLSSCAVTQQQPAPAAPAAQAQQPPAQAPAPAPAAQNGQAQAAEPPDSGINRDGQPLQLGRFGEQPPPVTPPDNNVVELNFEQEDLRVVFEQLGDALNINMVIDPAIDQVVSLRTSPENPLQFEDIWPLMRLLARNAGVTIERAGNVYEFKSNPSTLPAEILSRQFLGDAASPIVLQVTPLTFISVESALEVLNPMVQPEGSIIRMGPRNVLGVYGTPAQLTRINAILDIIDTDPFQNQGIRLYELLNSQAAPVTEELTNVLGLIAGQQPSYQVLPLERINSVLVTAPAGRGFQEVTRWINVLDAESPDQEEQLFIYRVKNLDAGTLADTLTRVFAQEQDAVVRQAEETPEAPQPIARLPQEDGAPTPEEAAAQLQDGAAAAQPAPPPAAGAQNQGTGVSANITVTIVADEDTNSLLIRGTPREYRQLLATIDNLDVTPEQVLINAVIAQATLTDNNQFGIDWTRISGQLNSTLSTRFLPGGLIQDGVVRPGSGLILDRTFSAGSASINATLNAIAELNEVTLLARPSILVTNNQEGQIIVGQEVPVDTGSTLTTTGTATNISFRDVGIVLTITPHINRDGIINLEIFQSLSAVEEDTGVGGNPIFTNQEVTTTAVVTDQSTIILGGLIQEDGLRSSNGVPGLNRIPFLGGLFGFQQLRTVRRELFIILRPQIIREDETSAQFLNDFRDQFEYLAELMRDAGL